MSKHHHIGLLTAGRGFLESANRLNDGPQEDAAPFPVYYLFFHGLELALKSFIYLKTKDEKELRKIGHNLEAAWCKAKELGIGEIFPENQELQECIAMVNPTYEGKEFEYFYPGFKRLPAIVHVSNVSNNLNGALDRHYRSELKKNT